MLTNFEEGKEKKKKKRDEAQINNTGFEKKDKTRDRF